MDKQHTKNPSGAWLQHRIVEENEGALATLMAVTALVLGFVVRGLPEMDLLVGGWPGWVIPVCGTVVIALTMAVVFVRLRRTRATWGRGWAAERRVGDRIEHALVRADCAFAHDVKEGLGTGGNLDHVALTPAGVWAVETKAAWLKGGDFKRALHQAAGNAQRLRRHLGTRIPVRAALVIADGEEEYERECDWKGDPGARVPPAVVRAASAQRMRRRRGRGGTGAAPRAAAGLETGLHRAQASLSGPSHSPWRPGRRDPAPAVTRGRPRR